MFILSPPNCMFTYFKLSLLAHLEILTECYALHLWKITEALDDVIFLQREFRFLLAERILAYHSSNC